KGKKDLVLRINILPPVVTTLTDAERARGVEMAKADRQSVFKADCAACHAKPAEGKYGKALYDAVCAICHEGEHRATMVPDLHNLKVPTNDEFWRTWTAHGKAGSLMPAFSTAEGGPLNDMQIATVAAFLNTEIPSQSVSAMTNAPPAN
ncbi:MAG TPA: cytochrome c, partial [Verrucomicrobiae bacterium]